MAGVYHRGFTVGELAWPAVSSESGSQRGLKKFSFIGNALFMAFFASCCKWCDATVKVSRWPLTIVGDII